MKVGVIKEIKDQEHRIALTPAGAKALHAVGHTVVVQAGAGLGSGFSDAHYLDAGARIVGVDQAWDADLVLKGKEPLASEYQYFQEQILFTYFHLAGMAQALTEHGKGVQLGAVLGTRYGKVVIIGDGVVGRHAAKTAYGMGSQVFLGGRDRGREDQLKRDIGPELCFFASTADSLPQYLAEADLVVGAVLLRAAKAPHVVTETMVQCMQPGSVIVDVSIDQGGCVATSRPTSHSNPVFEQHGVIHYCVPNMPGAYPSTSTLALTTATLPYVLNLAHQGLDALRADPGFGKGVNTYKGYVTSKPVAEALGLLPQFKEFAAL